MDIEKMFPDVVGQKSVLTKLKFFVEIQNKSGILPPVLISGQRGGGKNTIGSALLPRLINPQNGKPKTAVELNCSSVETVDEFFKSVVDIYLINKDVTLVLDEIHAWKKTPALFNVFLSIWNISDNPITTYNYGGNQYQFDSRRISYIALTSEPNDLPETIISRLEVIQLEELSLKDLSYILLKNLKDIKVQNNNLLYDVASVARNNGRESFKLAQNIYSFLKKNNQNEFTENDWQYIKRELGIRKYGINNIEYRILKYLKNHPHGASLTKLSSALQLTGQATRLGFERFLTGNDFIEVVTSKGRVLTKKGQEYLDEVKE